MHCLIDATNYRVIATHKNPGALTALAFIQYANVDTVTMPCDENRPFAQFTSEQLEKIYDSAYAQPTGAFKTEGFTYNDEIHKVRAMIEAAPHLRFPFSEDHMREQADKIKPDDERPWAIDANGIASRAKTWACAPQRDRHRYLAKPTAPQLTKRVGSGPAVSVAKAAKEAAPVKRMDTLDAQILAGAVAVNTEVANKLLADIVKQVKIKEVKTTRVANAKKPSEAVKAKPAPKAKAKPKVPKYTMTKKANGLTRADFLKKKWTDAQLIKHGYMKVAK